MKIYLAARYSRNDEITQYDRWWDLAYALSAGAMVD